MPETINDRVKNFRLGLKLTQKDFAALLDVKQSYYSEVESGKRSVTSKLINKLVKVKGVSADWLISGKGQMTLSQSEDNKGGKNTNDDKNNSLNSDNLKGSIFGGQDGGLQERLLLIQNSTRRLSKELERDFPELNKLFSNSVLLIDFQYFIKDFNSEYLKPVFNIDESSSYIKNGKFDYQKYKQDRLDSLEKVKELGTVLENLTNAIKQFYKDFEPLDTKNIIGGRF